MGWIFMYSVFLMFSVENVISLPEGACGEYKRFEHGNKAILVPYCCNYYHKRNGVCVENVISLPEGVCGEYKRFEHGNKAILVPYCCNYYHKRNGVCVACPIGYKSKGDNCTPCLDGLYGGKCAETCHCNATERCDHVKGCISKDDKTETKEKTSRPEGLSNSQDASNGQNNVVTYMTCIAVGSVLVVVCGLLVKNREAICRRSGSMTAMKTEITKRKRQNFGPGKSCGKDKTESLYAEINEKYMINFDGE